MQLWNNITNTVFHLIMGVQRKVWSVITTLKIWSHLRPLPVPWSHADFAKIYHKQLELGQQ